MTDLERFNLFWLCHAMTAPVKSEELYHYDARTKRFFTNKPSGLFDMVDLQVMPPIADDLLERMADIDSEASEIVEIPRLNVQDKIAVQLLFLSKFPGVIHQEALRLAAEKQQDTDGFVLDVFLDKDATVAPMLPYWDDFKLKTIQFYLEKFTGLTGIALRLL
ncbi:MAG: hypothetical protein M3O71_15405 [Bacteroidota bacterium]|nr:hypothetical protein [Bacteroidota bacterium]